MIVTIDNNTRSVELYHLSILFQSLAKAHGFVAPVVSTKVSELTVELNMDTTAATAAIDTLAAHAASKGVDVTDIPPVTVSLADHVHTATDQPGTTADLNPTYVEPPATDTNLDVNGLPWDARIHAGSRERNTDGSWRVRRKPKTVEQDEWDATLVRVTAELTDLMAIPVSTGAVADAAAEEALTDDVHHTAHALTDAEVDAFVDIVQGFDPAELGGDVTVEPVVVAPPVTIAPPVVVPPVTAVAPPITVDKPAIETFAQLMSWLTSRTPKDEAAKPAMVVKVNEILAANGLTTLQQLGQRADLIPQVLVQFREAFGE
jgi:hypothetical protein